MSVPVVYTPTAGETSASSTAISASPAVCSLPRRYASLRDPHNAPEEVESWIVVTDAERILGLGPVSMVTIPVGKLAFHTVCAGVDPVALDHALMSK